MPLASPVDLLRAAVEDIHYILVSPDIDIPLPLIPPTAREELVTLAECLLHNIAPKVFQG
jgi:hypothetical protein